MIELVVLACLSVAPDQCRHETIGTVEGTDLQACVFASQAQAAKWAGEHPKYEIKRIECRKAVEEA